MVDIPRSSFIPKESTGMTPGRARRTRTFHIFGFLATVALVGSILSAGFVYFLKSSATSNLATAEQNLRDQKNLFNPDSIAEVKEFDRRLQAADLLILNHVSPLKIFTALERYTKQRIQFTQFSLEHTPGVEVIVLLQGETPEFRTLALQESGFASDALLKNVVFSEVSTQEQTEETGATRGIAFSLKGSLNTALMLYDGKSSLGATETAFIETGDSIVIAESGEGEGAVLGDAVSNDQI